MTVRVPLNDGRKVHVAFPLRIACNTALSPSNSLLVAVRSWPIVAGSYYGIRASSCTRACVEELARRLDISPRQLERLFSAETGTGPPFVRILLSP